MHLVWEIAYLLSIVHIISMSHRSEYDLDHIVELFFDEFDAIKSIMHHVHQL